MRKEVLHFDIPILQAPHLNKEHVLPSKGSCLCTAVGFECENIFKQFHFCHCIQCQKTSGSAHVANLFTENNNITWLSGQDKIKRYDVPNRNISSAFCSICGSPTPYVSSSVDALIVPAGCLDGTTNIQPQGNIFWSERANWYEAGFKAVKFSGFPYHEDT